MSQYFSRLARKVFKDALKKWNFPVFAFQSKFCINNHFNFGLCTQSCEVMRSGRTNDISLWKKLRHLLHPVQDATLSLTSQRSFLSDAFISSLEQKGVGGRAIYPGGEILFKYVIARGEKRQSFLVWNAKSVGARYFEKISKWALNKFCCKWVTV